MVRSQIADLHESLELSCGSADRHSDGALETQPMIVSESRTSSSELTRRARVWLVDDSPLEREIARRLLVEQYEVEAFSDGPPVLERLAEGERPDVLVLDWHMPQMSGLEVCRFLRQTYDEASLPILVLTATGGQDDLLDGLAAGANDFVAKTFDPAELLARVGTLARAKQLHDSLKQTELATRRAKEAADEANRAKDVFMAHCVARAAHATQFDPRLGRACWARGAWTPPRSSAGSTLFSATLKSKCS